MIVESSRPGLLGKRDSATNTDTCQTATGATQTTLPAALETELSVIDL